MKKTSAILAGAMALIAPALCSAAPAVAIADKYEGYRLVFHDEFNSGSEPDWDVWQAETGYQRNNEAQYYQKENAAIRDGELVITGRKEKKGGMNYTSASIITRDDRGYNWQYGIYEVRAKLPCHTGCWPAIWTTGSAYEWPYNGEIDIMEYYPSGGAEAIHANVAWGSSTRWSAKWNSKVKKLNTYDDMEQWKRQYHTWTMIYTEESIKLYCDHNLLNQVNLDATVNPQCSWFPHQGVNPFRDPTNRQHVWLNLALGGNNGGSLSATPFPCEYLVDYVRVYEPIEGAEPAVKRPIIEEPSETKLAEPLDVFSPGEGEGDGEGDGDGDDDSAGIGGVTALPGAGAPAGGIYNLQGLRVADSIEDLGERRGIFIVISEEGNYKIVK